MFHYNKLYLFVKIELVWVPLNDTIPNTIFLNIDLFHMLKNIKGILFLLRERYTFIKNCRLQDSLILEIWDNSGWHFTQGTALTFLPNVPIFLLFILTY